MNFASNPNPGDAITLAFNLPDGSKEQLTLTATSQFASGGRANSPSTPLPANTAANFQAALSGAVQKLAATSLSAASAMAAANNFFNVDAGQPPMRVNGPPFDSATSLIAGTPANTVTWYTGEMGTDLARGTAVAKVDDALTVSYGARANEQAIRATICQYRGLCGHDVLGQRSERQGSLYRAVAARRRRTDGRRTASRRSRISRPSSPSRRRP